MRIEIYEVAGFVPFTDWLDHLPDLQARARIRARIDRQEAGNPGRYEDLIGGDKPSQTADIKTARGYLAEFSRRSDENQDKQDHNGTRRGDQAQRRNAHRAHRRGR